DRVALGGELGPESAGDLAGADDRNRLGGRLSMDRGERERGDEGGEQLLVDAHDERPLILYRRPKPRPCRRQKPLSLLSTSERARAHHTLAVPRAKRPAAADGAR